MTRTNNLWKAVLQRVTRATVEVDGQVAGRIGAGLLVLLGIAKDDGQHDLLYIVEKIQTLRIFADHEGKMNLSLSDVGGAVLVVLSIYAAWRYHQRPSTRVRPSCPAG